MFQKFQRFSAPIPQILLISIMLIVSACSPMKHVPEGSHLLVKNNIITDKDIIETSKFEDLIKQKPNRQLLGIYKFHLNMYNLGNRGKETRFKNWLKKIGEEPTLLDSVQTWRTRNQFRLLLNQKGFFNCVVSDTTELRKKKAIVNYYIQYNELYTLRNIKYDTKDPNIKGYIDFFKNTSLLRAGEAYDEELFNKERERISSELKDRGYYYFNKNYITFTVDSSLNSHQADVSLYINRINENIDPSLAGVRPIANHQSFYLNTIYIRTDYNPRDPYGTVRSDTIVYKGFHIISSDSVRYLKDDVLLNNIFISKGDRYLQRDLDYTYNRLQDLNIFKFINISFTEVPRDSVQTAYLLDVSIQLTPMEKQDFTTEAEATNTGGNFGIAGSFGYRNKNVFSGAEVFELKFKGALEVLPNFGDSLRDNKVLFFNTYELGPDASLSFKKFLLPGFISKNTSRYFNPRSVLNAGFNFQERPDYKRSILNASFGYNWQLSRSQRWLVYPVNVNSVYVEPTPAFTARLDSLRDPRLSYSYESHLIPSSRATWIFNNQAVRVNKNFVQFRANLEWSGQILRALAPSLNLKKDDLGNFQVFGIPFSQFIKPDVDMSYHMRIDLNNTLVYRFAAGVGFPFGNSSVLPFEKSFFAGGPNSLRAWNARTLGPGSYQKTVNIEQSGDIKLEANVEYRSFLFNVLEGAKLEGALFADAGNIWTRNEDIGRPGSEFKVENLMSELGLGAGAGLRFNFSFFILRFDGAVKLRDPSLQINKRWVYPNQKFVIGDITVSLAIGYPF
ncbi:MAG: hypothetical protein DWQ44_08580 [Bacteroidetes bacterium]|nr:MAG: hypothetical protein DWQ39_02110 [Bacteroidota bacterium]REK33680.1 MAG: hypothetical protein DWQ44_08580 [Bacteroidota bacterium]REK47243.1 MAG: hypothetical protein DWQ48_13145 [Bacteroidota bacterium]